MAAIGRESWLSGRSSYFSTTHFMWNTTEMGHKPSLHSPSGRRPLNAPLRCGVERVQR